MFGGLPPGSLCIVTPPVPPPRGLCVRAPQGQRLPALCAHLCRPTHRPARLACPDLHHSAQHSPPRGQMVAHGRPSEKAATHKQPSTHRLPRATPMCCSVALGPPHPALPACFLRSVLCRWAAVHGGRGHRPGKRARQVSQGGGGTTGGHSEAGSSGLEDQAIAARILCLLVHVSYFQRRK